MSLKRLLPILHSSARSSFNFGYLLAVLLLKRLIRQTEKKDRHLETLFKGLTLGALPPLASNE